MKVNKYGIICALALLSGVVGCEDSSSLLDKEESNDIYENMVFSDPYNATWFLSNIYKSMNDGFMVFGSDDSGGFLGNAVDEGIWKANWDNAYKMSVGAWATTDMLLNYDPWKKYYTAIRAACRFLEHADEIPDSPEPFIDEGVRTRMKGEGLLLAELRKTLDAYREGMLVTTAVGGDVYFALQTDMKEASRYLDYVQLMTYDLQGGFQKVTGHHAALYHSEGNLFDACVQKAVNGFVNAGVPMEKLILGVPFYSRKWDGVKGAGCRNGLGMEAETVGGYGGDYGELKESWIGKRGFIRYWDEQAKVPYLFDGETFISYEDCESLGVKIAYLKEKGMGGIMFWEYKCDPSGELLSFIKKNM